MNGKKNRKLDQFRNILKMIPIVINQILFIYLFYCLKENILTIFYSKEIDESVRILGEFLFAIFFGLFLVFINMYIFYISLCEKIYQQKIEFEKHLSEKK